MAGEKNCIYLSGYKIPTKVCSCGNKDIKLVGIFDVRVLCFKCGKKGKEIKFFKGLTVFNSFQAAIYYWNMEY